MIVFDLKCHKEHRFEAWFKDSRTYDRQAKAGQITCPSCGDTRISKAPMAPNIAVRRDDKPRLDQRSDTEKVLGELRKHVEDNFDYVGDQFADEARRIHYGETDERSIYGEASADEAKDLLDEGIDVLPMPWHRQNS